MASRSIRRTVTLAYQADLKAFESQLQAGLKESEEQLQRHAQRVQESKRALSDAEKAAKSFGDRAGVVGSVASKLGQALGLVSPELGALATGLADAADGAEGLASISAETGASLGALGVIAGTVAAAAATLALIYVDASREIGLAREVTETYHAASQSLLPTLRSLEDAQIDLAVATGELSELEGEATRIRREAQRSVLDLAEAQRQQRAALRQGQDDAQFWIDMADTYAPILGVVGLGLAEVADRTLGWTETIQANQEQLDALQDAEEAEAARQKELRDALIATTEAEAEAKEEKERLTAATREQEQASSQAAAALRQLQQITQSSTSASLEGHERIRYELEQQLALIAQLEQQSGDAAAAESARQAAAAAAAAKTNAENEKVIDAWEKQITDLNKDLTAAGEDLAASMDGVVEAWEESLADWRATVATTALSVTSDLAGALSDAVGAALDSQVDAVSDARLALQELGEDASASERQRLLKTLEAEKQAALEVWRVQQGVAYAQAAMDGIAAVANVWAHWAWNPPVAGALTAAAGVVTGTQLGLIAAAEPPEFHRGTGGAGADPSEFLALLRRNESVATAQGTAALGGRAAVEAANRGEAPAGGPQVLELRVGARTTERQVLHALGASSQARQAVTALQSVGRLNPYRR